MKKITIRHLRINNYRTFYKFKMSLHPEVTVIVGDNNSGKTYLVKALCLIMWGYISPVLDKERAKPKHLKISREDVSKKTQSTAPKDKSNISVFGYTYDLNEDSEEDDCQNDILLQGSFGCRFAGNRTIWSNDDVSLFEMLEKSLDSGMYYLDVITNKLDAIANKDKNKLESNCFQDYPIIASFGVDRLWQNKAKKIYFAKWQSFWLIGYHGALANKTRSICLEWLYDLSVHRLPFTTEEKFDKFIDDTIASLSLSIKHITGFELHESSRPEKLYFSNGDDLPCQLSDLGHGVQNMILMVSELVIRCSLLNPHHEKQAPEKTSGVVFIDEIDLHLHPRWQQVILGQLKDVFPCIQFIVTTHSPQVLSTVPRENIRVIEHSEAGSVARMPDFSPLAHESGAALAKVMGVHQEPPLAIQDDIRQFEQCVRANQEHSDEARGLRSKLDAAGYQFHDSDLATWRFLASRRAMEGKST